MTDASEVVKHPLPLSLKVAAASALISIASFIVFGVGSEICMAVYGQEWPLWLGQAFEIPRIGFFVAGALTIVLTPLSAWAVHRRNSN